MKFNPGLMHCLKPNFSLLLSRSKRSSSKTIIGLGLLLSSASAGAQARTSSKANSVPNPSQTVGQSKIQRTKIQSQVQGFVRFEAMQYPTPVPENPQLSQSLLASTNLRGSFSGTNNLTAFDISAGKYMTGGSQFQVNELSHSLTWREGQSRISLGRKIEFWSQLDSDWQLGLWQPKALLDSLRPEDQGLSGLFYNHRYRSFEFLAFATPIFVPSMGPEVKQKDGGLVADSRWYRPPSSTFPLFNKNLKLVYSLDIPDLQEIVNNPGSGFRAKYGGQDNGFWTSANYAYKPINALLLKYKRGLFLPEYDEQNGEVTIAPEVGYHHLYGADLGYFFPRGMVSVSYLADSPQKTIAESPYVLQQPQPFQAYSAHGETYFESSWFANPIGLSLNYLKVFGGNIKDFDSAGEETGAIFANRFNFNNAASIRADFSTVLGKRKFMSSFKFLREFEQKGSLFNSEITYFPKQYFALIMGADVLGVDDSSEKNQDSRFLNQFRANDRVYGGMSYVF